MQRQSGFTLIELVTVIVILGILAAFAIPRFTGLEVQARKAAVNGLAGSVKSASALGKALWVANGNANAEEVIFEGGQNVNVNKTSGYPTPTNDGIDTAVTDTAQGFTKGPGTGGTKYEWKLNAATNEDACMVTYDTATTPPTVSVNATNC